MCLLNTQQVLKAEESVLSQHLPLSHHTKEIKKPAKASIQVPNNLVSEACCEVRPSISMPNRKKEPSDACIKGPGIDHLDLVSCFSFHLYQSNNQFN